MLDRVAEPFLRIAASVLAPNREVAVPCDGQRCAVCGQTVSFDDNFVSWQNFATHLSCAFELPPELAIDAHDGDRFEAPRPRSSTVPTVAGRLR